MAVYLSSMFKIAIAEEPTMKTSKTTIANLMLLILVACAENAVTPAPDPSGCWFTFNNVKYTLMFARCSRAGVPTVGDELESYTSADMKNGDTLLILKMPAKQAGYNGDPPQSFISFQTPGDGYWGDAGNRNRYVSLSISGELWMWDFYDSLRGPADPITLKYPMKYISGHCKCFPD